MKLDRPQAAVPWIPSRHHYALFRLFAYLRLRVTPASACAVDDRQVLAIDCDQSNAETYAVGFMVCGTLACFFAELLSHGLHLAAAVLIAIPIAVISLSVGLLANGFLITPLLHAIGLPRGRHDINIASTIHLLEVALAASYFAARDGWIRVPAWIFLGCIAANGVAAILFFLMRRRARDAEARCVA